MRKQSSAGPRGASDGARPKDAARLARGGEESLGGEEIGGSEPLGEPAADRRQHVAGLAGPALSMPEAGETRGGPQFPGERALRTPAATGRSIRRHSIRRRGCIALTRARAS
jgi:hypothetical protein